MASKMPPELLAHFKKKAGEKTEGRDEPKKAIKKSAERL